MAHKIKWVCAYKLAQYVEGSVLCDTIYFMAWKIAVTFSSLLPGNFLFHSRKTLFLWSRVQRTGNEQLLTMNCMTLNLYELLPSPTSFAKWKVALYSTKKDGSVFLKLLFCDAKRKKIISWWPRTRLDINNETAFRKRLLYYNFFSVYVTKLQIWIN